MKIINFYHRLFEVEEFLNKKIKVLKKTRKRVEKIGGRWSIEPRDWEYDTLWIPYRKGKIKIRRPWMNVDGTLDGTYEVFYLGTEIPDMENSVKKCLKMIL